jgi:hypothetical protein
MLTRIIRRAAMPVGILVVSLCLWWFVEASDNFRDCIENAQYKTAQTSNYKKISDVPITINMRANCWGHYVNDYGSGTVAIFTIVLAGSTIGLWLVTSNSVRIAEKTLTELERPYLFILDCNWVLTEKIKIEAGYKCGISYSVTNGGKLPASITGVQIALVGGKEIPALSDAAPIHELLTAPLVAGGEKRVIIKKSQPRPPGNAKSGTALPSSPKTHLGLVR